MKLVNKHIHWVVLLLVLVGAVKQVYVLHDVFGFSWDVAVTDAVCTLMTVCLSLWSIVLLIGAYPTKVTLFSYSLLVALLLALTSVLTDWHLLKWWMKTDSNYTYYSNWLHSSLSVRFLLCWLFYTWIATNAALRKNIVALNSRFQQHADAALLLRDAELFKLRQQLQPHFLYNSLNSISALVMIAPDRAQDMIGKLSDFLRSSVKREAEDKISIHDELVYIESYLAIESVRFGDRMQVKLDRRFEETATIPPFLFQPILENAIKFGLYSTTGTVAISVSIVSQDSFLILTISNPFDAQTRPPGGTGFGLAGVGRRLYLLYARTDLLETQTNEHTFTTILKIPQSNA